MYLTSSGQHFADLNYFSKDNSCIAALTSSDECKLKFSKSNNSCCTVRLAKYSFNTKSEVLGRGGDGVMGLSNAVSPGVLGVRNDRCLLDCALRCACKNCCSSYSSNSREPTESWNKSDPRMGDNVNRVSMENRGAVWYDYKTYVDITFICASKSSRRIHKPPAHIKSAWSMQQPSLQTA